MGNVANKVKVSIFGAGGTGGAIGHLLAMHNFGEIVLIDTQKELAEGKALDIQQTGALSGWDGRVIGGDRAQLSENSEIVVITAGIGRRPGIAREELVAVNGDIMRQIAGAIRRFAPHALIIVLTNPADILTRIVWQESGFPANRVMGQGGILDSARLATAIAERTKISQKDIRAMVLGGHGDHMLPVRRFTSIHGIPADALITDVDWHDAVRRTRDGGGEILAKFHTHGASITPAHAILTMIEALLSPVARLLPVSVKSNGAYGLDPDVFIGLPAKLSNKGVEQVVSLELDEDELSHLHASAEIMNKAFQAWKASYFTQ